MPHISLGQAQFLAAGVMYDLTGQPLAFSGMTAVAVYPSVSSLGVPVGNSLSGIKASQVSIRMGDDTYFRPNVPAVAGFPSAVLEGATDYVIPIHPSVNTLYFLHPVGTTGQLNWLVPG